jgi:hypothetical protein
MSPEIDKDSRISRRRKIAQDLSELARSEFARSTRAADHFGQPFLACKKSHRVDCMRESLSARIGKVLVEALQFVFVGEGDFDRAALPASFDLDIRAQRQPQLLLGRARMNVLQLG